MAVQGDLCISRDLVNAQFDGYKLSLEPLPIYNKTIDNDKLPVFVATLENGVDFSKLTDEQFSYHHAKLLSTHNHLISDPWVSTVVYYVDKDWGIHRAAASGGSQIDLSGSLFDIPDAANLKLKPGRFNLSVSFPSESQAVVSDGAGKLYLLETGDRTGATKPWKSLYSKDCLCDGKSFFVADSVFCTDNETDRVECLLVYVLETDAQAAFNLSPFITVIEWISLASVDKKTWCLERTRRLEGNKPYDYLALDKGGNCVFICGSQRFKMVSDSVKPVVAATDDWEVVNKDDTFIPEYTWSQDSDDVHVQFTVPQVVMKADIYMSLSSDHVDMGLKNSSVLLKGALHAEIDVEGSTWTIEGQTVVLSLCKKTSGAWPTVVVGDNRGEMVIDPDQVAEIHQKLAAFTSDQLNPPPDEGQQKPYNTQELEDCDVSSEDSMWFMRVDGENHRISNEVFLSSHQWLFNARLDSSRPRAMCIRYDCDGSLWQPEHASSEERKDILKHVGMLHAFGYVQASKVQRKFSACAPDMSYAVICDSTRHLYIYRQNMPITSPLRNRKTGLQVNAVAKQQVVSLDTTDDILGLHTTNEVIIVLTGSSLFVVRLYTEE